MTLTRKVLQLTEKTWVKIDGVTLVKDGDPEAHVLVGPRCKAFPVGEAERFNNWQDFFTDDEVLPPQPAPKKPDHEVPGMDKGQNIVKGGEKKADSGAQGGAGDAAEGKLREALALAQKAQEAGQADLDAATSNAKKKAAQKKLDAAIAAVTQAQDALEKHVAGE